MGCISSKFLSTTDLDQDLFFSHGKKSSITFTSPNHLVSLTSSTYGVLNLDHPEEKIEEAEEEQKRSPPPLLNPQFKRQITKEEPLEIINTWELMHDLEEEIPIWSPAKKPRISPKKQKRKLLGKENNTPRQAFGSPNPNQVLKPFSSSANKQSAQSISIVRQEKTPVEHNIQKPEGGVFRARRSLSPFFDPELVASFERELYKEGEQIKKMVSPRQPRNQKARELVLLLQSFEEKCPPAGDNAVVLYTTTLRGIRKTFEDCNAVRTAIESHDVRIMERDVSMDSGFREELRILVGKEVKPPMVFVKGRLIGGAEEVLRLEEEGKLGLLLEGIPKAGTSCDVCGGLRFVMCMDCNGSCKVMDGEENKTVRCGGCNENGLVHCPMCC